eukprot:bmy_10523T0
MAEEAKSVSRRCRGCLVAGVSHSLMNMQEAGHLSNYPSECANASSLLYQALCRNPGCRHPEAANPETPNSTTSREASTQPSSTTTSQGYVLPEGKIMPNTFFFLVVELMLGWMKPKLQVSLLDMVQCHLSGLLGNKGVNVIPLDYTAVNYHCNEVDPGAEVLPSECSIHEVTPSSGNGPQKKSVG